jgi:hypothetical protein
VVSKKEIGHCITRSNNDECSFLFPLLAAMLAKIARMNKNKNAPPAYAPYNKTKTNKKKRIEKKSENTNNKKFTKNTF